MGLVWSPAKKEVTQSVAVVPGGAQPPLSLSRPAFATFPFLCPYLISRCVTLLLCSSSIVLKNPSLLPFPPLVLLSRFGPNCLLTLHSLLWKPHVLEARANPGFSNTFPRVCVQFLSSKSCTFQCTDLSPPCKIYSEVSSWFWCYCEWGTFISFSGTVSV